MKGHFKNEPGKVLHQIKKAALSNTGETRKHPRMRFENNVIFISICFGLIVWIGDATMDYFLFYERSFWSLLISGIPRHEIYIRSFMLLCFSIFGILMSRILYKHNFAKKDLEEARDNLENVINSSLDYIVISDSKGYITRANTCFLDSLGYKKEEVVGKHMVEFSPTREGIHETTAGDSVVINEEFLENSQTVMLRLLKEGNILNWDTYLMRSDTKLIPVEQNIVYLYDKSGTLTGSVGIIRDVSRRKKAEKEVKDSKDFLENIFNTTADGIMAIDSNAHIIGINKAVEELTGYTREELIGRHIRELGVKDKSTLKSIRDQIKIGIREKGFIKNLELVFLRKEGGLIPLEVNATFLKDAQGNLSGGVTVLRDISERKQAEEALRYRFKLEELITSISTNFIKLPLDEIDKGIDSALQSIGKFINVDRIYVFLFNDNGPVMDMAYEWVDESIEPKIDHHKELNINSFSWLMEKLKRFETTYIPDFSKLTSTASSEQNILHSHAVKSFVAVPMVYGQSLKGFLGFVSIREEKRWMEEDINLLQTLGDIFINALERKKAEEAKLSEQLKNKFLTNITHELRTPLTIALGPLEELLMSWNGTLEKPVREKLELSFKNIKKLFRLINQLLEFSRIEAGAAFVSYQKRNVKDFVEAILASFSHLAERKNIEIVFLHDEGNFSAYIDPEKMDKVLANVIGNAFKFTPERGKVEVECKCLEAGNRMSDIQGNHQDRTKDFIEIVVKDNGIGIQHKELGKIFERFQQANANGLAQTGGTGIGLSLAKELIGLQGGTIDVDSIYGQGSTFTIRIRKGKDHIKDESLILQEGEEIELTQSAKEYVELMEQETEDSEEKVKGDRPLILVVDDNQDMRRYMKGILKSDYAVTTANDGMQAWEKIKRISPSLIISDIMMPGMDGNQLCKKLKSNPEFNYIPFIFLTAKTEMEMKICGLEQGADEYIVKPFSALELMARVKSLLKNRELMRENLEKEDRISSLTHELQERYHYQNIVGQSTIMQKVFQTIESIKKADHPVLITGETGTGKELIAKSLHYISARNGKSFIVQNCSAFSEHLLESEIFGHVKGAFTGATRDKKGLFELADNGTLFLDEIGDLSIKTQAKLLRVLENETFYPVGGDKQKKTNIRLITATNKDLKASIREGAFREDLFYRLNVLNINLPPLRDRMEDVPLLIDHFLNELEKKYSKKKHFSNKAVKYLLDYSYPGNIRELKNIVGKSYLLCSGRIIQSKNLPPEIREDSNEAAAKAKSINDMMESAQILERQIIIEALAKAKKNKTRAAHILNITKPTLYKRIKQYKIDLDSIGSDLI